MAQGPGVVREVATHEDEVGRETDLSVRGWKTSTTESVVESVLRYLET